MARVNLAEAAKLMGISAEGVRLRIKKGRLIGDKSTGQWLVELPDDLGQLSQPTTPTIGPTPSPSLETALGALEAQHASNLEALRSQYEIRLSDAKEHIEELQQRIQFLEVQDVQHHQQLELMQKLLSQQQSLSLPKPSALIEAERIEASTIEETAASAPPRRSAIFQALSWIRQHI